MFLPLICFHIAQKNFAVRHDISLVVRKMPDILQGLYMKLTKCLAYVVRNVRAENWKCARIEVKKNEVNILPVWIGESDLCPGYGV